MKKDNCWKMYLEDNRITGSMSLISLAGRIQMFFRQMYDLSLSLSNVQRDQYTHSPTKTPTHNSCGTWMKPLERRKWASYRVESSTTSAAA